MGFSPKRFVVGLQPKCNFELRGLKPNYEPGAERERTRAEEAERKAARLAEKLRGMGIDPDAESE